jgi:23S rRNA (uracil1939-C5)-methyltransferase
LFFVINLKKNDTMFGLEPVLYHGQPFIIEQFDNLQYRIGPKSFFQTNSRQGKILYDITLAMADLQGHETVYDLYTGVGSIALYAAAHCKKVIGIEEVEEAIDDARLNMDLNKISNASFYAGDVKKLMREDLYQLHGRPDVIITDPPRAGMHADVVQELLNLAPDKIVYVSCNPGTQARDVALMSEHYVVAKSQAVDMFPHTKHIENVILLKKK